MNKCAVAAIAIVLASFVVGIALYPQMPEKMASHWGIAGNVDGYMPKFWSLFLMPIISVCLLALFVVMPKIDPLKKNYGEFMAYYDGFVAIIIGFLFYLYLLTITWALGARFNMIQPLAPAFAVLFYYCGVLVSHAKRNWFVGIRTPWTLSSESVWDKTHKLGGKLFKGCGVIALLGIALPDYAIFFVLAPIIFAAVYTVAYSYFEYRKEAAGSARKAKA